MLKTVVQLLPHFQKQLEVSSSQKSPGEHNLNLANIEKRKTSIFKNSYPSGKKCMKKLVRKR